jgi:hypothetical protein
MTASELKALKAIPLGVLVLSRIERYIRDISGQVQHDIRYDRRGELGTELDSASPR